MNTLILHMDSECEGSRFSNRLYSVCGPLANGRWNPIGIIYTGPG